ncbi:hypothetical protein CANTEDRAFT_122982 [Yamadazyma tenuis ATCC 10573]|uniref:Zn(2)-C6 fungal-type domain-containing protein n=1 Tax=Candida tenuis (strain ATCC 10573 / BCRC 21748 / CBS 615 / JCM 9827 / NBRC 10315 / NRRL Y-1498 / VKM Y-70) TaxID=590646 RepID=G3B562_CANTC|nr:uncharacterized protein CANTEDRAFT_122982 [Yamadazyma tenuis ATCC 10573]EGV63147.1 hypothetical protein CANTEDRAFT_122982 [Yamadazyma tenuis ATCC 10573]
MTVNGSNPSDSDNFASIDNKTYKDTVQSSNPRKRPMKKRKYSRGGCEECKRRKMKCDEGKPFCYNCTRLNKACVYKSKNKFNISSGPEVQVPESDQMSVSTSQSSSHHRNRPIPNKVPTQNSPQTFSVQHYMPSGEYMNTFVRVDSPATPSGPPLQYSFSEREPLNPVPLPGNFTSLSPSNGSTAAASPSGRAFKNAISDILSPSNGDNFASDTDWQEMKHLFDEATILVSDMNDLQLAISHPNSMASNSPRNTFSDTFEKHVFEINEFSQEIINNSNNGKYQFENDLTPQTNQVQGSVSNTELIEYTIKQHRLVGPHAAYLRYLNKKVTGDAFFPFASSVEHNEVVNVLLKYSNNCPYLLSALLAMIATVEFNITGKPVHELSGQKYVSVCLKSLSQAFASNSSNKVDQFLNDIERLLLTVILLSSIFSSKTYENNDNILNSWKTHLRGTKDLLINYSNTTTKRNTRGVSRGTALARTWFFAIESLASITTPFGGTLSSRRKEENHQYSTSDIDTNDKVFLDTGYFGKEQNPDYYEALVSIGLIVKNNTVEFNLFLGFTLEFVLLVKEYTKVSEYLRAAEPKNRQISSPQVLKLLSLVEKSQMAVLAPMLNTKDCTIPESSPAHPQFPRIDPYRLNFPEAAYGTYKSPEGHVTVYSWFDLSQQIHTDSLFLRVLLMPGIFQLPKSSPLVQELLMKLANHLFYVLPKNSPDYDARKDIILCETDNYFLSTDMFDSRVFMTQSAFRLITGLLDDDDHLEKIELIFKGMVELGNGSAVEALNNVISRRTWLRSHPAGGNHDPTEVELAQSEVVPFA